MTNTHDDPEHGWLSEHQFRFIYALAAAFSFGNKNSDHIWQDWQVPDLLPLYGMELGRNDINADIYDRPTYESMPTFQDDMATRMSANHVTA